MLEEKGEPMSFLTLPSHHGNLKSDDGVSFPGSMIIHRKALLQSFSLHDKERELAMRLVLHGLYFANKRS